MHFPALTLALACAGTPEPAAPSVPPVVDEVGAAAAPGPETWEAFERGELWGYRDAQGVERIAPRFHYASSFMGAVAWAADEQGLWWIDAAGAPIARSFVFDNGGDEFVEGLARLVDDQGKVGFLDRQGQVVVPPSWDFAAPFELGRAVVCTGCGPEDDDEHARLVGGQWGAIDLRGQVVIPVELPDWQAAADAAAERQVVLEPDELSFDEAAGTATWSPGSRRMSDEYTTYVLDLASLDAVLGARPTEPTPVRIRLQSVEERTETPSDPNLPAPQGGFHFTTYTATVVGR